MFARVLKSTTQHPAPSPQPPTNPSTSRSNGHAHSQSASVQPSPSKIPLPATPAARSPFIHTGSKENNPVQADRSNYLSFLFTQNQTGAPTTPVKVNKVAQPPAPVTHRDEKRQQLFQPENEDVHMQTMKNTVNPAMLKSLASIPPPASKTHQAPGNPYAVQRNGRGYASEDVYMKTAKLETRVEKEKGLELWERELLEKAETKRKATVAQICE